MKHARRNDPITSKMAVKRIKAHNCDKAVAELVLGAMYGVGKSDEDIYWTIFDSCTVMRYSPDRIRHGRLLLARIGMIEVAGRKKLSTGAWGRTWRRTK